MNAEIDLLRKSRDQTFKVDAWQHFTSSVSGNDWEKKRKLTNQKYFQILKFDRMMGSYNTENASNVGSHVSWGTMFKYTVLSQP